MTAEHDGNMVRVIAHHYTEVTTANLRDPGAWEHERYVANACLGGEPRIARQMLVQLAEGWLQDLQDQGAMASEYQQRWFSYMHYRGMIDGLLRQEPDGLRLMSHYVSPNYGKIVRYFTDFTAPGLLRDVFGPGHEVMIWGHTGAGKTHVVMTIIEALLAAFPHVHVITNIPGIRLVDGTPHARVHQMTRMSDKYRKWCELPDGTLLVEVIDEPESSLAAGAVTKAKEQFRNQRYLNRKMRTAQFQIWHSEDEILKSFRIDKDVRVTRIAKDNHKGMTVMRRGATEDYIEIPPLSYLTYEHEGFANFTSDLDLGKLFSKMDLIPNLNQAKAVIKGFLDDPDVYLEDQVPAHLQEKAAAAHASATLQRAADLRSDILQRADEFVGSGYRFERETIRSKLNCTVAKAAALASELNKQMEVDVADIRAREATFIDAKARRITSERLIERGGYAPGYAKVLEVHLQRKR
jgi:hypothetical protein